MGSRHYFNLSSPSNIALAEEVDTEPEPNTGLGKNLTFLDANTGFGIDFTLRALQQSAGFTFDDNEGSGPQWSGLSVGDIKNYQNDDWHATFTSSSGSAVFGFGWLLGDNGNSNNESFTVYNTSNELIGTLSEVPFSDLSVFIGFTSSEPVGRVVFDEGAGGDDIAINELYIHARPVPEPSAFLLLALLVPLILWWKYCSSNLHPIVI
ncbi:MAG: hypothetical protein ACK5NG_01440 [Chthoniobacterales bacterium]